jgi:4-amino-4-deoxy-L-arabinose transferase-like glycosyltransferase
MGLAIYLPALVQIPLIRSEAMYALIPQEMMASGHWLTPTLNGAHYLDKPLLLYWLNLLAYKVLGVSAGVARLPTLILTLGEIGLTYLIGLRLLGQRAAWLGGLILLSCVGFFALHLQLLTDHLITLTLLLSFYFLLRWQERPGFRWLALFHLALVAGFLSKGFIGLLFPLLIGTLYAWHVHQPRLPNLLFSPQGLLLLLLLSLPWFVAAEQANPGLIKAQVINEQLLRFMGHRQPADTNPFSISGFWLFLGLWLIPWTVLLPEALWRFWRETGSGEGEIRRRRLLLIWAGVIMLFFTLSSGRIEYYSLPALPPLALILGWRLDRSLDASRDPSLSWGLMVVAGLGLAILYLLPSLEAICGDNRREFIGMFALIEPIARPAAFAIPALALAGVLAGWRRPPLTVACYAALALMTIYFTFQTLVALSPQLSDQLPGEYLKHQAGPKDVVVMESIEEFEYGASLAFYAGRRILMVQRDGFPQFPYPVPPEEDYLISPARLKELWQGPGRVFLLVDDATTPEPYLKGAPVALAVQGKRLLVNRP